MNRFSTAETVLAALHEGHMQHLDEGTIHAWLDDALAPDEAAAVATHVAECRDCAALVAEARGMIAAAGNIVTALDDVRGGVIPSSPPARRTIAGRQSLWRQLHFTPARAALAATLLIAVGSVLTVRNAGRDQRAQSASTVVAPVIAQSTPIPSSTAPQPQLQTRASTEVVQKAAATPSPTPSATPATVPAAPATDRARNALAPKASSSVADARQAHDSARSALVDRVAAAPVPAANAPAVVGGSGAQSPKTGPDSTRAAAPERRAEAMAVEGVVATAKTSALRSFAVGGPVEGCYEVRVDSASSSVTGILPRFELTSNSGVRTVTPGGHADSIVPGGRWERLTANVVRVRFPAAREQEPFTLQFSGTTLTGRAGAGDRATNLAVRRIDCRP